jgi:hypothetical protein
MPTMGMQVGGGNRNAAGKPLDSNGKREWSHGLCGCFESCGTCKSRLRPRPRAALLTNTPQSLLRVLVPLYRPRQKQAAVKPPQRKRHPGPRWRKLLQRRLLGTLHLDLPRWSRLHPAGMSSVCLGSPLSHPLIVHEPRRSACAVWNRRRWMW